MDYMQRISVFTLGNFVEMMSEIKAQSGVEGWSKMFRTKEQQDQLEQVMIDVKVGEQLLPQELRNPTLVGRRQRLRMASDAGVVRVALPATARAGLHDRRWDLQPALVRLRWRGQGSRGSVMWREGGRFFRIHARSANLLLCRSSLAGRCQGKRILPQL